MGTTIMMISHVPKENLATGVPQVGQFATFELSLSPHSLQVLDIIYCYPIIEKLSLKIIRARVESSSLPQSTQYMTKSITQLNYSDYFQQPPA